MMDMADFFRKRRDEKALSQRQNEAIKRFIEDQRADNEESFDEEFDAMMAQRLTTTRELDL